MIHTCFKLLFAACCLLLSTATFAQTPELFLEKLHKDYQLEKIFIHTDKQFYMAGDTIWLKAYVLADDLPSDKSSKISISLVNDSSKAISQLVLPVQASYATGNFVLSDKLSGGTYSLQAYTNYMGVRDKQSFYNRSFRIINLNDDKNQQEIELIPRVNFFPEGGYMIDGINNTIAVKCTDQFGYPLNATGTLIDNAGKDIYSFRTTHEGMGKLRFIPEAGQFYKARLVFENGSTADFSLPTSKATGLGLETAINTKDILLVLNEEKLANTAMRPAYMILSQHNILVSKSVIPAQPVVSLKIPTTDLATGILQVTFFTESNQPLLERLFFINNDNYQMTAAVNSVRFSNAAKDKNILDFSVRDTFPATFSVSIVDAAYDTSGSIENTIASDLLLTEELRGYVHNPAQYFLNNTLITRRNADMVMMTNGWRRYNWETIMSNRLPVFPTVPVSYLNFKGNLTDKTGTSFKGGTINTMVRNRNTILGMVDIDIDESGDFALENFIIYDSFKVEVIKIRDLSGKPINIGNLKMNLTNTPVKMGLTVSPLTTLKNRSKFIIPSERLSYYSEAAFGKEQTLQGVRVEATKRWEARNEVNDRYTQNTLFGSGELRSYDFINEPLNSNPTQTLFNYATGRFAGIQLGRINGQEVFIFRSSMSLSGGSIPMTIVLDNVEVSPANLRTIPMKDIALVKVYSSNLLFSSQSGGILAIFTKRGSDFNQNNKPTQNLVIVNEGYSPIKEFYSPDYTAATPTTLKLKDNRNTLYWEPNIQTSNLANGKRIEFYNSDNAKSYKVTIEGFSADGKFLHLTKVIEK